MNFKDNQTKMKNLIPKKVKALSLHLNFDEDEIELPSADDYQEEFVIMDRVVEVLTREQAKSSEESMIGAERLKKYITKTRVGDYRQLNNSNFYFKWY